MIFLSKIKILPFLTLLMFQVSSQAYAITKADDNPLVFGSCNQEWKDTPIWKTMQAFEPSHLLLMGDNVYADSRRYAELPLAERFEQAYQTLTNNKGFNRLRKGVEQRKGLVMATWDDHDYGMNDGGFNFDGALEAKAAFHKFFNIDKELVQDYSQRGIYHSQQFQWNNLNVNVILLDTRSFRGDMERVPDPKNCSIGGKHITLDGATILGEKQWQWLSEELKRPADLRLIVSSIQVIPEEQCFEKWANFPAEREKFFSVIAESKASGVVLLSGDRHLSEVSKIELEDIGYPLFEITSSGLNNAMGRKNHSEINLYRQHFWPITKNSFATMDFKNDVIVFSLRDEKGESLQSTYIPLEILRRSK